MAIRTIRMGKDPILRKESRDVTVFDERLHQLLDDMAETMASVGGAGLAAVQVGVLRRAVVVDVGEGVIELINPVLTDPSAEAISSSEGCLSFPGQWGLVARPQKISVQAQDRNGNPFTLTGEDLLARALCHEVDHLNGVVFIDLATEMLDPDDEEFEGDEA